MRLTRTKSKSIKKNGQVKTKIKLKHIVKQTVKKSVKKRGNEVRNGMKTTEIEKMHIKKCIITLKNSINVYYMSSIEVVDVNNETKTDEPPINNEVVEQNETVNEKPMPEEVKPEGDKPEPKVKAKALPRTKKEVELVECEQCSKNMTLKSLRHSHPKNCKGAPTELLYQLIHKRMLERYNQKWKKRLRMRLNKK